MFSVGMRQPQTPRTAVTSATPQVATAECTHLCRVFSTGTIAAGNRYHHIHAWHDRGACTACVSRVLTCTVLLYRCYVYCRSTRLDHTDHIDHTDHTMHITIGVTPVFFGTSLHKLLFLLTFIIPHQSTELEIN